MSQERRRAREARQAAAALLPAAPMEPPPRAARQRVPGRGPVYRQRRFPPLPWRLKVALALGWLTVVVLGAYLFSSWPVRLGIVVLATACLPLTVVLVRDPTRRTSR